MQHLFQQSITQNPPDRDRVIPIPVRHDLGGKADSIIEPLLRVSPPKHSFCDR